MSNAALKAVTTGTAVAKRPDNFPGMLEAYKGEIARALPRHLNPDTMARVALTCFRMNPKLSECQPASVFAAVIQASQLGLRPGLMGECYLIPYKDQCTLQLGYQGLLELVRRSGLVDSIGAYLVHERDTYAVRFGTDPGVTHEPCLDGDPGPVRFGYAVAKLKGGGTHVEVMTLAEINRIRDRSQNVKNAKRFGKETPWDTDWDEMARKTLIRRICKYLPKSNELATALALDDAAGRGSQVLNVQDAIANTFVPPAIEMEARGTSGDEQPVKTLQDYIGEIDNAPDRDTAAAVVESARAVLTPSEFEELGNAFAIAWEA
jgi:recombination protein RecT